MDIYNLLPIERYGSNCYLLSSSGEFAVVDPSASYEEAVKMHPEIEGKVKCVLLTHAHFDHFLAINSWADRCDTVYVGAQDSTALADSARNCYLGFLGIDDGYYGPYTTIDEGDTIQLGKDTISVIACPGHTPGGLSFVVGNNVFCGDTLFAQGGYGRCDLPGGDIDTLEKTLIKLITHLPDDTVFYPGHGPKTTLKEVINYFM